MSLRKYQISCSNRQRRSSPCQRFLCDTIVNTHNNRHDGCEERLCFSCSIEGATGLYKFWHILGSNSQSGVATWQYYELKFWMETYNLSLHYQEYSIDRYDKKKWSAKLQSRSRISDDMMHHILMFIFIVLKCILVIYIYDIKLYA